MERGNECHTQRVLAQAAQIKTANLSGMERGVRSCGPDVASRLASALGLQGQTLIDFMRLAATTTERGHLWVRSGEFDHLLSAITSKLRRQGVDERSIVSVSSVQTSCSMKYPGDLLVVMANGSRFYIEIKAHIEQGRRL